MSTIVEPDVLSLSAETKIDLYFHGKVFDIMCKPANKDIKEKGTDTDTDTHTDTEEDSVIIRYLKKKDIPVKKYTNNIHMLDLFKRGGRAYTVEYIRYLYAFVNLQVPQTLEDIFRKATLSLHILPSCNACLKGDIYGFTWPNPNGLNEHRLHLCMDCIYASALHFQAQQSWHLKHGDPISNLQKEVQSLREEVKQLNVEIGLKD